MKARVVSAIDIGTSLIKVMSMQVTDGTRSILGVGHTEAYGIAEGYITHEDDAARSIRSALAIAEKQAGAPIEHIYLAQGGIAIETAYAHGEAIASRSDQIIVDTDIDRVMRYAEESLRDPLHNAIALNHVPLRFMLDGKRVTGRPHGMHGTKLEADTLFILAGKQQHDDTVRVLERAGVSVLDTISAPLATALVAATKTQKRMGCMVVDIGAETTSLIVYDNALPVCIHVFPTGSTRITADIALSFRIAIEEADKLKRLGSTSTTFPKKKLEEIILTAYTRIFHEIRTYLEERRISLMLPAGVILTGGGSISPLATNAAREILELPVSNAVPDFGKNVKLRDPIWATVYGACVFGASETEASAGVGVAKKAGNSLVRWLKQFLP